MLQETNQPLEKLRNRIRSELGEKMHVFVTKSAKAGRSCVRLLGMANQSSLFFALRSPCTQLRMAVSNADIAHHVRHTEAGNGTAQALR